MEDMTVTIAMTAIVRNVMVQAMAEAMTVADSLAM
jgi:hypothetical protein